MRQGIIKGSSVPSKGSVQRAMSHQISATILMATARIAMAGLTKDESGER